jgi:hypothetical protein
MTNTLAYHNLAIVTFVKSFEAKVSRNHYIFVVHVCLTKVGKQCDQIGPNFVIRLLFAWVFLIFSLYKRFQKRFLIPIMTFKSSLMKLFWTFHLSFNNLATVWATFPKFGRIFSNFWSLCWEV